MRYRRNYDGRKLTEPRFKIYQQVFIDELLLAVCAPTADTMVITSYDKTQHRTRGPYKIVEVSQNTTFIDGNRVHCTVSIHQICQVPSPTPKDGESMTDTPTKQAYALEYTTKHSETRQPTRLHCQSHLRILRRRR